VLRIRSAERCGRWSETPGQNILPRPIPHAAASTTRAGSSGYVMRSHWAICSGDQSACSFALTMRRKPACCASRHAFGRKPLCQARCSAIVARYCDRPPCRRISRLIVDGARPNLRANSRTVIPVATPREISSRSSTVSDAVARRRGCGGMRPNRRTTEYTERGDDPIAAPITHNVWPVFHIVHSVRNAAGVISLRARTIDPPPRAGVCGNAGPMSLDELRKVFEGAKALCHLSARCHWSKNFHAQASLRYSHSCTHQSNPARRGGLRFRVPGRRLSIQVLIMNVVLPSTDGAYRNPVQPWINFATRAQSINPLPASAIVNVTLRAFGRTRLLSGCLFQPGI